MSFKYTRWIEALEGRRLLSGTDGTSDLSFAGGAGAISALFGPGTDTTGNVITQPDGKIVVAVRAYSTGPTEQVGAVRFNEDGTIDTSFGAGGFASIAVTLTPPPGNNNQYTTQDFAVAIDPGSSDILVGTASGRQIIVARFTTDGQPDGSFGTGGIATMFVPPQGNGDPNNLIALAVTQDGTVYAGGGDSMNDSNQLSNSGQIIFQAAPGMLVQFSSAGVPSMIGAIQTTGEVDALAVDSDGDVLVAGDGGLFVKFHSFVNITGQQPGTIPVDYKSIAMSPNGKRAVIAGSEIYSFVPARAIHAAEATRGTSQEIFVSNLAADASFDIPVQPEGAGFTLAAMQPGGRVIVGNGSSIERFNADGSSDATFNSSLAGFISGMTLDPGMRLVTVGNNGPITVARYTIQSLAASVSAGVLAVTGTPFNDTISYDQVAGLVYNGVSISFNQAISRVVIYAGAGDDSIKAGGCPATLWGGAGDDTIVGGQIGNDSLYGGPGSDLIIGGDGNNSIFGGDGAGNDTLIGGGGNRTIPGGGDNTVAGGSGDDYLAGDWEDFLILQGDANDFLNTGSDQIIAGSGNDTIASLGGNDTITGGAGNDYFALNNGSAQISNTHGGETVAQNDTVTGSITQTIAINLTIRIVLHNSVGSLSTHLVQIPTGAGASPLGVSVARSTDASGDVVFQSHGARTFMLGDFFNHWGVGFSSNGIGQYETQNGGATIGMTVNGANNSQFNDYQVQNGDNIVITYFE